MGPEKLTWSNKLALFLMDNSGKVFVLAFIVLATLIILPDLLDEKKYICEHPDLSCDSKSNTFKWNPAFEAALKYNKIRSLTSSWTTIGVAEGWTLSSDGSLDLIGCSYEFDEGDGNIITNKRFVVTYERNSYYEWRNAGC